MHTTNFAQAKGVIDMRAVIDGLAAKYAALGVAQGANPESFLSVFDAMQKAAKNGNHKLFLETDLAFHMAIVELANIKGLVVVYKEIRKYQIAFQKETIQEFWPDLNVLFEGHRQITDAILDGDPNAAEDFAKTHLEAIWYRLAERNDVHVLPGEPLDRACAYIAFQYDQPIRLDMLAKQIAKISPGHLARLFRENKGLSFTDYLRNIRLQKAAEALRNTKLLVSRVGKNVGYLDSSRFAIHFRRKFGMTPIAYRKTHTPLDPKQASFFKLRCNRADDFIGT